MRAVAILLVLVCIPAASAFADATGSFAGVGGGFTTFRLVAAPGDLSLHVEATAFGRAVYGLDLYDAGTRERVGMFRFVGTNDGDGASAGVADAGASVVVPQPVVAAGSWHLQSAPPTGCMSSSMSWAFAELGHHLSGTWYNCDAGGRALVGVVFGAGEHIGERRFAVSAGDGATLEVVESSRRSFFLTLDEFEGTSVDTRIGGNHVVFSPDLSAQATMEHGFIGAFRARDPGWLEFGYEGPAGAATCSCSIREPNAPGEWTFRIDGAQLDDGWIVLGGVDAALPFS